MDTQLLFVIHPLPSFDGLQKTLFPKLSGQWDVEYLGLQIRTAGTGDQNPVLAISCLFGAALLLCVSTETS